MRLIKLAAPMAILLLTLLGCGGGGGGNSGGTPPTSDSVAPTVSLTAPAAGQVTGITTLTATAADNVGVTKVEFYLNTTLLGTSTTAPYSFNWDTSTVVRGTYTLSAKAYDAANNGTQSAGVVVTVPISASVAIVPGAGNTAVGTVFLAGASAGEVFGLNLNVTMPAGTTIASAIPSGVAAGASTPLVTGSLIILPSTTGFGSGQVLTLNLTNVPAGTAASAFSISVAAVFGSGGVQIQ